MKESGLTTKLTVKENIGMLMVIIMKDSGSMIKPMEKEFIHLQTALAI